MLSFSMKKRKIIDEEDSYILKSNPVQNEESATASRSPSIIRDSVDKCSIQEYKEGEKTLLNSEIAEAPCPMDCDPDELKEPFCTSNVQSGCSEHEIRKKLLAQIVENKIANEEGFSSDSSLEEIQPIKRKNVVDPDLEKPKRIFKRKRSQSKNLQQNSKMQVSPAPYSLNQNVYVKFPNGSLGIGCIEKISEDYSTFDLRWYFCPQEFRPNAQISEKDKLGLGINEVFFSSVRSRVPFSAIFGKCSVYPFEEYLNRSNVTIDEYYVRAFYDVKFGTFDPPIESWERFCICQEPHHPNKPYIVCDKCDQWFHFSCVGITNDDPRLSAEKFYCPACEKDKEQVR